MIKNVDLERSSGPLATFTRGSTKMTKEMVTERCIGPTDLAIRVSGSEVSSMDTGGCVSRMGQRRKVILRIMSIKSK